MISKRNSRGKKSQKSGSVVDECSTTQFATVPSFLLKTYEFVCDPETDDIISWNKAGDAFIIYQTSSFCERVLPAYFSHKNFSSFVRQLNLYGFNKNKGLRNDQSFSNPWFKRGKKELLLKLKRKTKESKSTKKGKSDTPFVKDEEFRRVMADMKHKSQEQEQRISFLENQNKDFKNSVLALYTELERMKEREKNANHIHFDFGTLMNGQSKPGNLKEIPENSAMSQNISKILSNMLKGGAQNNDNQASSAFLSNFTSTDERGNNLMIENGACSPKVSPVIMDESKLKKRDLKSEAKDEEQSILGFTNKANCELNLNDGKLSEKNNLLSIDHSVASDIDILKSENSVKNEYIGDYSLPSPGLSPRYERPLAIMPKSPSISEYLGSVEKKPSADSLSSFSAGGSSTGNKII